APILTKTGYRQLITGYNNPKDACCQWYWDLQGRVIESRQYYAMMPQGELTGVLLKSDGQKAPGVKVAFRRFGDHIIDRIHYYSTPIVKTSDSEGRFQVTLDAVQVDVLMADEACGNMWIARIRLKPGEHRQAQFTVPERHLETLRGEVRNL